MEPCYIDHLSPEMLLYTMSFLEPKDLAITESVCKIWQEASNCRTLWRRHCETKYGQNYIASVGYLDPKAAWLLPIYIRSFQHILKPVALQLSSSSSLEIELHGQYLVQRNRIWVKDPCSKISKCHLIYDLIRQEQIPIPSFFEEAHFIKWTICNKKQAVVAQDKQECLIYSEAPFEKQITYNNFDGSVLNVTGNRIFYTSKDKMQLSAFNLNEGKTIFTMGLDSPIQSFFASEYAHAAVLNDHLIIFNNPSDLSMNFKVPFDLEKYTPRILSNQNWLVVTFNTHDTAYFHACNLASGNLYMALDLPIGSEKALSQYYLLPCMGLELCNNYLFVCDTRGASVVDLGNLDREKERTLVTTEFCEFFRPVSSFGDQFFFFVDARGKVYFTDVATNQRNQVDLDFSSEKRYNMTEFVSNGRFIGVSYGYGRVFKYADLLAPERSSSKHFLPLNDKRVHKKMKISISN